MRDIGSHAPRLKALGRPKALGSRRSGRAGEPPEGVGNPRRCPESPAATLRPGGSPARSLWVIISAPWYCGGRADLPSRWPELRVLAKRGHSRRCPASPGMTAFNTARTLRRMFDGTAYLERAAPRFAVAKFLTLAFTRGLFIELAPGSNCPDWIFWPGRSALASRFLAFCAAFAFARWRALALVMSSSPF